mgnify:CR=1
MESNKNLNHIVNPLNHDVFSRVKTAELFCFSGLWAIPCLEVNRSDNNRCFALCSFGAFVPVQRELDNRRFF